MSVEYVNKNEEDSEITIEKVEIRYVNTLNIKFKFHFNNPIMVSQGKNSDLVNVILSKSYFLVDSVDQIDLNLRSL